LNRRSGAVLAVCCAAALLAGMGAAAAARVPLPKPRPAEAPKAVPAPTDKKEDDKAVEAPRPQPSACRLALTEEIAIAPSLPPITGPGACGGDDIVRLEAIVLPDRSRVPLKPAATLRCTMAAALAAWVRTDIAEIARDNNTGVSELDNFDSFDCRGQNRIAGARLSEHGRANALDVRGVKFSNGQFASFTDRNVGRETREKILASLCARFTTVLGPGSDGYHEDHIHIDLAERRSGYRICQWDIWDPWPKTAPLMPASRPDEAPPRETAEEKSKREAVEKEKPVAAEPARTEAPAQTPAKADAPAKPAAGKERRNAARRDASKKGAGTGAFRQLEKFFAQ
jgi:hypothetical protein